MPAETPGSPTTALDRLIMESENWLMARILHYAKTQGFTRYTSTLLEAWQLSISGLSASLVTALRRSPAELELSPDDDYSADPAAAFGVTQAKRHRQRGINLAMFLALMKYYRQAYLDLVDHGGFAGDAHNACRHAIIRFFDRVEIGFTTAWLSTTEQDRVNELQDTNRRMTNEKNKYLTVFESLPIAVILVGDDLYVENMNDTARRFIGKATQSISQYYPLEPETPNHSVSGKQPFSTLFPWLADAVLEFTRDNQPGMYFITQIDSGSRRHHIHVRLSRMLDVSDKFRGTLVFLEDVSERILADQAVKEKESFLHTVLDAIQDGICVLDPQFNILQVNQAMEKLYQGKYPLVGKRCYQAYHGRQEMCTVCPSRRAMDTGQPQVNEIPLIVGSQQQGWLEIYAYPLKDGGGTITGVVEYVRDITENKKGEAALRESERLQGVLETAGAVGHELNQPLQSVMGQSELMFLDLDPSSPVYPRMALIREQVYKMGDITRKLMGITRYRTKRCGKTDILDIDNASTSVKNAGGRPK
ncbi:MAG: PAS domain-containing protein [Pseudomonadota bacterium]